MRIFICIQGIIESVVLKRSIFVMTGIMVEQEIKIYKENSVKAFQVIVIFFTPKTDPWQ